MYQEKLSHVSNSSSIDCGKICELLLGANLHVGNVSKPKYLSVCPPALCLQWVSAVHLTQGTHCWMARQYKALIWYKLTLWLIFAQKC